jgi:hypothetical protein
MYPKNEMERADWICLAEDTSQWQALVNTAMNPRVPWNTENFLSAGATTNFSDVWSYEWTMQMW